jgi:hypothetical protein
LLNWLISIFPVYSQNENSPKSSFKPSLEELILLYSNKPTSDSLAEFYLLNIVSLAEKEEKYDLMAEHALEVFKVLHKKSHTPYEKLICSSKPF